MPRSSHIYIVLKNGQLHSAFTVKHELLSRLPETDNGEFQVLRLRDGSFEDQQLTDISNEVFRWRPSQDQPDSPPRPFNPEAFKGAWQRH